LRLPGLTVQAAAVCLGAVSGWMHNQHEALQLTLTQYRHAQESLRESERRHRQMFEKNRAVQMLIDPEDGRIVDANSAAAGFYGYSLTQLKQMTLTAITQAEPEQLAQELAHAATEEQSCFIFTHLLASGEARQVELYCGPVRIHGRLLLYAIVHDITERQRAQEALKESERQYRTLIEQSNDAIYILYNNRFELINKRFSELFGVSAEEVRSPDFDFMDLVAPESMPVIEGRLQRIRRGEAVPPRYEFTARARNGRLVPLEVTVSYVDYRGGTATQGILRDITARKEAEEALQRRTAELEALVKVSADMRAARSFEDMMPVVLENAVNLVAGINGSLYLVEPESGDLVARAGHPPNEYLLGRRFKPGQGITGHVALTGEIHISENLSQDPLAHILPEEEAHLPLTGGNVSLPLRAQERIVGILNVSFPESRLLQQAEIRLLKAISEIAGSGLDRAMVLETLEQRVEERTRELAEANRRLTELDQLKSKFVSDVSHELRTPVANLSLYVDLMERGKPEKRASYLSVLRDQTDRLVHLITDVLNLAQLEFAEPRAAFDAVDLNSLLEQLVSAHRLQAETAGLILCFSPLPGLPPVRGDRHQLSQIITNLLTNAINYSQSGEIRVETCLSGNGERACFSVGDDGVGIDAEDIPHLFDRFYRGRATSQSNIPGSGLGLAIVKEIVDQHGGEVQIESAMGAGATFRIYLPVTTDGSFTE
jgi:PAS domain S-box-containing protein